MSKAKAGPKGPTSSPDFIDAASDQAETPATPAAPRPRQERVFAKNQKVPHDLFKLEVAAFRRDMSINRDGSLIENVEHVHFFHTYDSQGTPQRMSNLVGQHFHEIQVIQDPSGGVPEVIAGPAMVWVMKDNGKGRQKTRVAVPYDMDEHTHEVTYCGSQEIQLRKSNVEFAKYDAERASKQEISVPGIAQG